MLNNFILILTLASACAKRLYETEVVHADTKLKEGEGEDKVGCRHYRV